MGNPEKPSEGSKERQGTKDTEAQSTRLDARLARLEKLEKSWETEKRKDDWEKMGDRARDHGIKKLIEEIGKNPDYFNSEETLRDAALRLAKEISRASSGTSIGRDWSITSQQDKFDWDKLIGGSTILRKAFSQDTLDTAKALAEIDRRTSVYGEKSRMWKYAERFGDLIRQAKDPSVRDSYLKKFLNLHAAVWEDKDAIAYLQGMADSNDNPAVKAAAKTAQAAIEYAPKMNDEYRRRLVLNFVDYVSKILGAAAPAAPAKPSESTPPRVAKKSPQFFPDFARSAPAAEPAAPAAQDFTPDFLPASAKAGPAPAPPEAGTPTASAAAAEKAPRQPKMTDARRIQIMEKLGFPLDKVKVALNITADKPSEIVTAIRKAQGDIWKTLKKDDAKKFIAAKKFADGIWGPESQKALQTIAAYDGVDKKWKDRLAVFGGKVKDEAAQTTVASMPKATAEMSDKPLDKKKEFARQVEKAIRPLMGAEVPLKQGLNIQGTDDNPLTLQPGEKVQIVATFPENLKNSKINITLARFGNIHETRSIPAAAINWDDESVQTTVEKFYKENPLELASLKGKWQAEDRIAAAKEKKQTHDTKTESLLKPVKQQEDKENPFAA